MPILRFLFLAAAVVTAIILAAVAGEWLLVAVAALVLLMATAALFSQMLHYTSAAEWLGPSEEAQLQETAETFGGTGGDSWAWVTPRHERERESSLTRRGEERQCA